LQRPVCFAAKPAARLIEQNAHELLADYYMTGEWFDLDLDDAASVVDGLTRALAPT
jgi:hypothetical protein